jgi:hypothetical protein
LLERNGFDWHSRADTFAPQPHRQECAPVRTVAAQLVPGVAILDDQQEHESSTAYSRELIVYNL